ncbi:heat shock protein 9/12-domain-containing protein [Kockovaella imperatae]|uniref:Heat shock protein 9/12-domain-containing protein n=1 Tax=Kockovaella imperatae TaxID=4999 RepID=A0A1Y1URC4_9TREE|nr:heat shock protein 9/12-domain-containing protein [Kockovaella imperatae]ORX40482.1 heat shock protein 9/12-domain-containing protein [Kockovaella imperatae]
MSDMGRQSFGDKAEAALKPDSQKSYLEQAKDTIAGKADSAASSAQPESQKSWTQQAGDAISGNQNENSGSLLDKAKDALGMNENKPTTN